MFVLNRFIFLCEWFWWIFENFQKKKEKYQQKIKIEISYFSECKRRWNIFRHKNELHFLVVVIVAWFVIESNSSVYRCVHVRNLFNMCKKKILFRKVHHKIRLFENGSQTWCHKNSDTIKSKGIAIWCMCQKIKLLFSGRKFKNAIAT